MGDDAKEEVRSRLNIEDVIGEYIQLQRAGRNFKGLSPFTGEKTPSFIVSPEKQIWHDFSANRGGDIYSFVMAVEGMDFVQALEHLARKAGVDLSQYRKGNQKQRSQAKSRVAEAHQLAARFYQACLVRTPKAVKYIKQRNLNRESIERFMIGYAPSTGDALQRALTKRGVNKRDLADGGLSNRYGGDLFRDRLMVPLMDGSGQVIGFTGRLIGEVENAPKYLNTPQTVLYDKSRHIFGLSQAKEAIRQAGYVVIVEGNLDVVSSHQAGVRQVVATAGTAMTEHHLKALKRLTGDIRLAFDGDKAGVAATERAIAIAAEVDVSLTIVAMPDDAKDPDELIQSSPEVWQQVIDDTKPAVDWVLDQYAKREDLKTAAGKRNYTTAGLQLVARLQDTVERQHYEDQIAATIGSTREAISTKRRQLAEKTRGETKPRRQVKGQLEPDDGRYLHQDDLLAIALIDAPSQELLQELDLELLAGDDRRAVARYLAANRGKVVSLVPKQLHNIDTYVKILLLRAEARYAEWTEQDRYFEAARLLRRVEHEHKKQTRDQLTEQLRDAEAADDDDLASQLRIQLNTLIKEIARGQR